MANLILRLPTNFKCLSVSASSNGAIPNTTTHSKGPVVLELPLEKIRRPLVLTRSNDPIKVKELMDSISVIGLQEPDKDHKVKPLEEILQTEKINILPEKVVLRYIMSILGLGVSSWNEYVVIDVLDVDGVYYGFSGCHRYEAHQRLGLPTIRCKVRRGTKETLRHHLR